MRALIGSAILFLSFEQLGASMVYFQWDKPHGGKRGNVAAVDLAAGKVVWEVAGKSVNFVHEAASGVVVGNDEGEVVLLDKDNGKQIWRCRVESKAEIKHLLAETEDGFFVSSGDSPYWLVSKDGKLLLRCTDVCAAPR